MQPCMQEAEGILPTVAGADVIQFLHFLNIYVYMFQNNPSPFNRKQYVCASFKSQSKKAGKCYKTQNRSVRFYIPPLNLPIK